MLTRSRHKIRKAVIPVAGLGTRMLPATKAIPKEMLPIVDKPLIQYIVTECVQAGLKEIVLVTHNSKNSIENHFDTSFELETMLEKRVKRQLLEEVRSICPSDVTIMHVRQGEAKGLGHAIKCSHPVVGDEPVAILLPDVLIDDMASNLQTDNLARMLDIYDETGISQIMVEPVPREKVSSYGIVDINGHVLEAGDSVAMSAIIEKPEADVAPSSLAVVGRYVLCPHIWKWLGKTPLGAGDEIQLTDSIDLLMREYQVNAFHLTGKSHDCGSKLGYMAANMEYGVRHPKIGKEFTRFLKEYARSL